MVQVQVRLSLVRVQVVPVFEGNCYGDFLVWREFQADLVMMAGGQQVVVSPLLECHQKSNVCGVALLLWRHRLEFDWVVLVKVSLLGMSTHCSIQRCLAASGVSTVFKGCSSLGEVWCCVASGEEFEVCPSQYSSAEFCSRRSFPWWWFMIACLSCW